MNSQSPPAIYVVEITGFGESDIRLLTAVERTAMETMDIEEFELWKHDGRTRFWAFSLTSEEIRKHGFSMTDQYSKNHGCHETDFVALGNGVYEEYEVGFDQADALIRQFGSFLYFLPQYSWGSNGCEVLPPTSDLLTMIPSCFVSLIASKELVALSVTSDVDAFVNGYLGYANGTGGESVKTKALKMGLIEESRDGLRSEAQPIIPPDLAHKAAQGR